MKFLTGFLHRVGVQLLGAGGVPAERCIPAPERNAMEWRNIAQNRARLVPIRQPR